MFNKIKNWLSARNTPAKYYSPPRPNFDYAPLPNLNYVPTNLDIDHLVSALEALIRCGIRLSARHDGKSLRDIALDMANREGFFASNAQKVSEWTSARWAIIALWLSDDEIAQRDFENVAIITDHCYDGADEEDCISVIRDVIGLAKGEWIVEGIRVEGQENKAERTYDFLVHLQTKMGDRSFKLKADKDFDWRLLDELNVFLPATISGRFAMLHDGGSALVVFLTPEQIESLGEIIGFPLDTGASE